MPNQINTNAFLLEIVNNPRTLSDNMSAKDTTSTDSLKQKSLTSFFSKGPAVGSTPKTPAVKTFNPSSASNAKYKSNLPSSSPERNPKTPESRSTDLRALNSSAAASARSATWSHGTGSTPPTSDPIPIDVDEGGDVVMLSDEERQVTSIKSVSTYIYICWQERKAEKMYRVDKRVTNVKLLLTTRMTMIQKLSPIYDEWRASEVLRLLMQFEVCASFHL